MELGHHTTGFGGPTATEQSSEADSLMEATDSGSLLERRLPVNIVILVGVVLWQAALHRFELDRRECCPCPESLQQCHAHGRRA
jgi:hypothetical protein